MKKYYLLFLLTVSTIFFACDTEEVVVIQGDSLSFRLYNYTDKSYQNGELFIGARDRNGNFVPTESIDYAYIPSKLSPNGNYTILDNCTLGCGDDGLINGYHYFSQNGELFVKIPFSPDNNVWTPDLNEVLAISDDMEFMLKLPDGTEEIIGGFNLRITLIENDFPVNALVKIFLRDSGIEGGTTF